LARANRLLASLTHAARQRILAVGDDVELVRGEVVHEPGNLIEQVYFPTSSSISVMLPVDGSRILEVGLVGDEGMLGLPLLLGVESSPLRAVVQGAGHAWRVGAEVLLSELERNPPLRRQMLLYQQVIVSQLAQTAACTRFHLVEERLARWLLMTEDRAHRDEFFVTHEFLAYMLGVRRVGVTKAATALQKRHLIHYHRGAVVVLDRSGLESASCSCYRIDRETYEGLLPAKIQAAAAGLRAQPA
jgi:CRP-like cAMP-binding protein